MSQTQFETLQRALADMLYDHIHPHGCDLEALAAIDILALLVDRGIIAPLKPIQPLTTVERT